MTEPRADAAPGSHPDATHRRYWVHAQRPGEAPRTIGGVSAFDRADALAEVRRIYVRLGHIGPGDSFSVSEVSP